MTTSADRNGPEWKPNTHAEDIDLRNLRLVSRDELRAAWAEHKRQTGGE